MTPRPFLLRLLLPFSALIILIVGVCGTVIYVVGQQSNRQQQLNDLERFSTLVRRLVPANSSSVNSSQEVQIRDLAAVLGTRITLIGGTGVVLLDTQADAADMENHNSRPEVIEARSKPVGSAVRFSNTIKEDAIYFAELLDRADKNGVVLRLSFPQRMWPKYSVPVWAILVSGVFTAGLVMLLLALILQRQWIAPVRDLALAAEAMARGSWDSRVEPRGADDLRFFSNRLNLVAAHAEKQLADLNHQRSDLQVLVDSLPDPILLTDAQRRIALINVPAARLLQITPAQAIGKGINFAINDEPILALVEATLGLAHTAPVQGVRGEGASIQREIRLTRGGQRTTYQAIAKRSQTGGVLLVLRNITTLATTVQMKTDFVANASHELRTPIAAIKIAFETLRECYTDDPEQTEKCVGIIDGHIKRLEDMLGDLLDLSRVESPESKPQIAEVRCDDLFATVHATQGPVALQKKVELVFEQIDAMEGGSSEASLTFASDRRLLDLILKNLVENSLKFTPAGGKITVRATLRELPQDAAEIHQHLTNSVDYREVTLQVCDTGIGIPAEHLERVFERFYQVNSARTGTAGRGTGLGLSIVKHAAHALGGAIELKSTVGRGTTVTCHLPIIAAELPQPESPAPASVSPDTLA